MEVIQSDQSRLSIGSDAKCDSTLMGLHMLTRWEKSYKTVMYLGEAQHGFCELGGRRMNSLRYADDIQNLDRDIYLWTENKDLFWRVEVAGTFFSSATPHEWLVTPV